MEIFTYDEVIERLNKKNRIKHLLLGNGFSMAYDSNIFSYNALSKFIEESDDTFVKTLFTTINTRNFEQIMRQLTLSKNIILAFGGDKELIEKLDHAMSVLKRSLLNAVKSLHPEHVFSISEDKCNTCANFLKEYLGNGSKVFSTNYDILLYWVLMRNQLPNAIDGFGRDAIETDEWRPEEEIQYSELRWGKHKDEQNIFYLHGALPFFDCGIEVVKEEYDGNFILENIKKRMENGQYPIFVTAGDGNEKLNHIVHNQYLLNCYENLCSINGSLITFGFNFGDYDDHIINAINAATKQDISSRLWSIYIGVFSESDIQHINQIEHKFNCKVHLFDSRTINIWG
jgi:hypothetical protein